ncbi:glutamate--tRNA ligase [uncultured Enterovirga sp.]|uniref:glutamate--tRNA ligase n=1 Tax=uncultured Enterovirga sp. TaxID=2026352 RepID=UPI0035CA7261
MPDPVVTRFAPSPTGFLHIGGARTALFNWLYARRFGGRMLLRIEDTDRERSTEPAIAAILEGLSWLGLDWDGDVVYQSSRVARHREVAESLVADGRAYRCWASQQELGEMRDLARKEGRAPRYDGRWRDRDPAEAPADVAPVIRLRAPQDGETVIEDQVQGRVVWQNKDLDDLVLLRSDGTPTYMLAVVVDDQDMGITHIIRGDDHLTNGARQSQIYQGLGWSVPTMAHIPLIHGPDGAKLSKRHGALGIDAYRTMGYLPSALRNYLVRLGWSHGNQEIFSDAEMVASFDLPQIGRSPARFDFAKLENLNGHHLRETPDEAVVQAIEEILPAVGPARDLGPVFAPALREQLLLSMPSLKERAKTLIELLDLAYYLYGPTPLALDAKAEAILDPVGRARLAGIRPRLAALAAWDPASLEAAVRAGAEAAGVKLGQIAQPLRAAVTGRGTSPGLFDVMAIVGRDLCLARIDAQADAGDAASNAA